MKLSTCIAFIVILQFSTEAISKTSERQKNYNKFLNLLDQSPTIKEILQSANAQKYQAIGAPRADNLIFTGKVSQTNFEQDLSQSSGTYSQKKSITIEADLTYSKLNSLELSLNQNFSENNYDIIDVGVATGKPKSTSLTASYDILNGATESSSYMQAAATASASKAKYYQALNERKSIRISFLKDLADFSALNCKINSLNKLRTQLDGTVNEGAVQLKVKLISTKDYLNYSSLKNQFDQKMLSYNLEKELLFNKITTSIPQLTESEITQYLSQCQDFDPEENKEILITIESLSNPEVISNQELYRSALDSKEAAEQNYSSLNAGYHPDLRPFISTNYNQQDLSEKQLLNYTLGINFRLKLDTGNKNDDIKSSLSNKLSTEQNVIRTFKDLQLQAVQIKSQYTSQIKILSIIKTSIDNSKKLLKVLNAQKSIGGADSLNLTNSYLTLADNEASYFDSIASLEKLYIQSILIKEFQIFK